tara:strand:+ start:605 stop:1423 length:819 start_codon:yes stop_codon:yes gene_type:complete
MPRHQRSLSKQGCQLFNISLENKQHNQRVTGCLKSLIYNLFNSDFDDKLNKSLVEFRHSTCKLLSFLNDDNKNKIPNFFNNAVTNLVYLILVNNGKLNSLNQVRNNVNFYYYLAEAACKNGDHNTALLIRTAINNIAIKRLKLKFSKKHKKIRVLFLEKYGTFMSCNSNHLREILNNKNDNFLPSLAILLMHYNKSKEYYKCYTRLGKLPINLANKNDKLKEIVELYYSKYKENNYKLQDLYLQNTNELELVKDYPQKSCNIKLIELSKDII